MPKIEIHCKNSMERTGQDFKELHEWMDEPGKILQMDHRRVRHDLSYLDTVKEKFAKKYGVNAIKEFLLHIAEDYQYSAEQWGQECKTPGCKNRTFHQYKYCNKCRRAFRKREK